MSDNESDNEEVKKIDKGSQSIFFFRDKGKKKFFWYSVDCDKGLSLMYFLNKVLLDLCATDTFLRKKLCKFFFCESFSINLKSFRFFFRSLDFECDKHFYNMGLVRKFLERRCF